MDGDSERGSLLSSASVVAAVIGCVTAIVSAVLPWWLSSITSSASMPTIPSAAVADVGPIAGTVPARPMLTLGVWTIVNGVDEAGTDFSGSTLKFSTQRETPEGLELTGFFEWRVGLEVLGREYVVAHYDAASRQVFIEGQYVQSPQNRLAVGSFSARLSDDGRQLLDGRWGNTPGNLAGIPGSWEARR